MNRARSLGALLAATLGLALAGCGTADAPDAAQQARAAVQTLLAQCAAGRAPAVLGILTEPAQQAFADAGGIREGCQAVVGLAPTSQAAELETVFRDARAGAVRVTGDAADVEVVADDGSGATVAAERHGDDWRITSTRLP